MELRYQLAFSNLHRKALLEKQLFIEISSRLRKRVWLFLQDYNERLVIQRNPDDSWSDESDTSTETSLKLRCLYGLKELASVPSGEWTTEIEAFLESCEAPQVFDTIQIWYSQLEAERQRVFQRELNVIFQEEDFPWCFCKRSFFQLDSKFMEERLHAQVHELLSEGHYGALQEFVEARNDLSAGDYKGAILNACKAYESAMKVILGQKGGDAGKLIVGLLKSDIVEDVPQNVRGKFGQTVLQSVPFLRNTLAGHGQGAEIVTVSRELAELSVHFAGALILFCVRKHLALNPSETETALPVPDLKDDEDLPF